MPAGKNILLPVVKHHKTDRKAPFILVAKKNKK